MVKNLPYLFHKEATFVEKAIPDRVPLGELPRQAASKYLPASKGRSKRVFEESELCDAEDKENVDMRNMLAFNLQSKPLELGRVFKTTISS